MNDERIIQGISPDDAWEIIRNAKWEGAKDYPGFPAIISTDPALTEGVMRSLGFKPGRDICFGLVDSRPVKDDFARWPSEKFPVGFESGQIR